MQLPYFEDVDLNALKNYYDVAILLDGKNISLDLNFDHTSITEEKITLVKTFLKQLTGQIKKVKDI